jgi:ribosomal protein S18 acetylase RimI-like enzyme
VHSAFKIVSRINNGAEMTWLNYTGNCYYWIHLHRGILNRHPVYHALLTGDAHLGSGNDNVKYFDEQVSPFVGFAEGYDGGFDALYQLLSPGRKILYASRTRISEPPGWQQLAAISGLQFIFDKAPFRLDNDLTLSIQPIALGKQHVAEMVQLAALTKPGPFDTRTIEFGHYHGIFEDDRLVAMTGQRLHPGNYTEISAVCTHPDHVGKGYAAALLEHELSFISRTGQIPFLHVREDNARAIALYERLGFRVNGPMNFYFLKRRD